VPEVQREAAAATSEPSPDELQRQVTLEVLETHCGACHGAEARATDNVQGDLGYLDDLDRVVERGLIVALESGRSRVVQVMLDGSMPPRGVEPRPSAAEIAAVRAFIDRPAFYSDDAPSIDGPDSASPLEPPVR